MRFQLIRLQSIYAYAYQNIYAGYRVEILITFFVHQESIWYK